MGDQASKDCQQPTKILLVIGKETSRLFQKGGGTGGCQNLQSSINAEHPIHSEATASVDE